MSRPRLMASYNVRTPLAPSVGEANGSCDRRIFPRPPDGCVGGRKVFGTSMDHCWFAVVLVVAVMVRFFVMTDLQRYNSVAARGVSFEPFCFITRIKLSYIYLLNNSCFIAHNVTVLINQTVNEKIQDHHRKQKSGCRYGQPQNDPIFDRPTTRSKIRNEPDFYNQPTAISYLQPSLWPLRAFYTNFWSYNHPCDRLWMYNHPVAVN